MVNFNKEESLTQEEKNIQLLSRLMPKMPVKEHGLIPLNSLENTYEGWQVSRDRVLLYIRCLDLPPFHGVELALESLKKSGATDIQKSMETLHSLLQEHGLNVRVMDDTGYHLTSMPPVERGIMVVNNIDRLPYFTLIKKWFSKFINLLFGKIEPTTRK